MHLSLNPLSRKRLRRFRRNRRAWWSFWILAGAYALSLGSELICGDRPLVARCQGRWYFPVARYYPEDAFLQNDRQTRPDYLALQQTALFDPGSGNFMLFPPFPSSPYASLNPNQLQEAAGVEATFVPMPHVGSVNVDAALTILRSQTCGHFFVTNDPAVNGIKLDAHWPAGPELRQAVAQRLRNARAPAFDATLNHLARPGLTAAISLPAYTPRDAAPDSVRITLRDAGYGTAAMAVFASDGRMLTENPPPVWTSLPPDEQARLTSLAARAAQEYVPSFQQTINGSAYRIDIRKRAVTWPHEPVGRHWMGIDSAGRDVFARILYGFRISMSFGFLLVAVTIVLGVLIGAVQGYLGGRTDMLTQRLIEIWSALPFLYVMILLGSIYGRSFMLLLICYGIFNWIGISYYIRAEFLRLRRQPYVEAARCLGVPGWRIMLEHILPNALTPLITFFPFSLVGAISALYALDYLGFGLPPPTPSWGELLYQAQQFRWAWWLILYPAAAIFMVMLLGVFIGEGVRDAFDPKPVSRME